MSNSNDVSNEVNDAFSYLDVNDDDTIHTRVSGLTTEDQRTILPTPAPSVASLRSRRSSRGQLLTTRQGMPAARSSPSSFQTSSRRGADVLRRNTEVSGGGLGISNEGVGFGARSGDYTGKRFACIIRMGDSGICFGAMGNERFCRSECVSNYGYCGNVDKHKSTKATVFESGNEEVYVVPATKLQGCDTAYLEPYVSVQEVKDYCNHLTQEEFQIKHTSQEWGSLILEAKAEIKAAKELAEIIEETTPEEEGGFDEAGNYNPDEVPYNLFTPPQAVNIPPPVFTEEEFNDETNVLKVLQQHQEAIATNSDLMKDVAASVPAAAASSVGYLDPAVKKLMEGFDETVDAVKSVIRGLGNWQELSSFGHSDMTKAIVASLEVELDLNTLDEVLEEIDTLKIRMDDVGDTIKTSNTEVITTIAGQMKKIHLRMVKLEGNLPNMQQGYGSITQLDMATPIVSAGGVVESTLGQVLARLTAVESKYEQLRADIAAQGGVVVGSHSIPSEDAMRKLVAREAPNPKRCIAAMVDPVSLFSHSKDVKVGSVDGDSVMLEEMKSLERSGLKGKTPRKYITTFGRKIPYSYNTGNNISAGSTMSCAKSMESWNGQGKTDGNKFKIMKQVNESKTAATKYVQDNLPASGSVLTDIAKDLIADAVQFHKDVHEHATEDMRKLTQLGIKESEVMEMVAEGVMLMFEKMFTVRKDIMDYDEDVDPVDYVSRLWWGTLQAHKEMKAFTENGIAYHPVISAAFVRFLTAQLGQNMEVGLSDKVTELEEKITKVEKTVTLHKSWQDKLLAKNSTLQKPK